MSHSPDDDDSDERDLFGDVPEDEIALSDALLYIRDIEGVENTHRFSVDHVAIRTRADANEQLLPPEALRFLNGQGFQLVSIYREPNMMDVLDAFSREDIHQRSEGNDPGRQLISDILQHTYRSVEYMAEFKRGDALLNHASEVADDPYQQWQPR